MCGIVGFSGKQPFNPDKIKILLLYNESRGRDSTGYWTPTEGIRKAIDEASVYLSKWPVITPEKTFIGHCRKTSMGGVTKHNAHPFEFDNIIGAHNGHIPGIWRYITENEKQYFDLEIDSQALIYLLSKEKSPLFLYYGNTGAAAILFTDKRDSGVLYAFKNRERPLFYGTCEEGMYISSMKESLEAIQCTDIKEFNITTLYRIKEGTIEKTEKIEIAKDKKKTDDFENGWYVINTDLHAIEGKFKDQTIAKKGESIFVRRDSKDHSFYFTSNITHTIFSLERDMFSKTFVEDVIQAETEIPTIKTQIEIPQQEISEDEIDEEIIVAVKDIRLLADEVYNTIVMIHEEGGQRLHEEFAENLKQNILDVFDNFLMATA